MIAHLPITGGWRDLVLSEWFSLKDWIPTINNNPHQKQRKIMESKVCITFSILTTVLISVSLVRKSPLFSDIWSRNARHLNTHVRCSPYSRCLGTWSKCRGSSWRTGTSPRPCRRRRRRRGRSCCCAQVTCSSKHSCGVFVAWENER